MTTDLLYREPLRIPKVDPEIDKYTFYKHQDKLLQENLSESQNTQNKKQQPKANQSISNAYAFIINPSSNLSNCREKWIAFENSKFARQYLNKNTIFHKTTPSTKPGIPNNNLVNFIRSAYLNNNIRHFVACGGDGTVNMVVNAIKQFEKEERKAIPDIILGALGFGSSNDFHKFEKNNKNKKSNYRINFRKLTQHDIGKIKFKNKNMAELTHYFISSTSIGVVADAAYGLYKPNKFIGFLKSISPNLAVNLVGFLGIFKHRNRLFLFNKKNYIWLTSAGIVKNNCFGGNLKYDLDLDKSDGHLGCYLTYSLSKLQLMRLMLWVSFGKFRGFPNSYAGKHRIFQISSKSPFVIECDGEMIDDVLEARFTICKQKLLVCSE